MTKNPYNGHDREAEGRAWDEGYAAAQVEICDLLRDAAEDNAAIANLNRIIEQKDALIQVMRDDRAQADFNAGVYQPRWGG